MLESKTTPPFDSKFIVNSENWVVFKSRVLNFEMLSNMCNTVGLRQKKPMGVKGSISRAMTRQFGTEWQLHNAECVTHTLSLTTHKHPYKTITIIIIYITASILKV